MKRATATVSCPFIYFGLYFHKNEIKFYSSEAHGKYYTVQSIENKHIYLINGI